MEEMGVDVVGGGMTGSGFVAPFSSCIAPSRLSVELVLLEDADIKSSKESSAESLSVIDAGHELVALRLIREYGGGGEQGGADSC